MKHCIIGSLDEHGVLHVGKLYQQCPPSSLIFKILYTHMHTFQEVDAIVMLCCSVLLLEDAGG